MHAMISVWALLDPRSETYKELHSKGYDLAETHLYDATNPAARDAYWNRLPGKLLSQGWDAFWLDSSEPEEYWPHVGNAVLNNKQLAIGNGATYTNIFPLLHNLGVQEHWKETRQDKRVCLLTRSAFLGQQRVGAITWSGDVYSAFWSLKRQVPAGLNFAISGMPYWATDIGGYKLVDPKDQFQPWFQELYTRWFEFGTFSPIFRTHGHRDQNEIWAYKNASTLLIYDKLRYRLLPYIYSLAWKVTNDDYTIQRPLVMDWRLDPKVREIGDQFMFGPALMVSPVLEQNVTSRSTYLPASPSWYDFWTGEKIGGEQRIEVAAPVDTLPLHVRAGSILPLGPEIEYAGQKPGGPIELRVYRGADGKFDLYEDSGDSYDYEKGQHSIIPLTWNDETGRLTIGARQGSFPGMSQQRTFRIVLVSKGHGVGPAATIHCDKEVSYSGEAISVPVR
jgi:alpha-D-xyloside xylohydrolase